ncbi:MAG: tRNA ((37)-N6)-dimethylallyltransferase MiaA [Bacteroidota bacterium]|jgi:tRNA dimethylallyltransferase
MKTIDLITIVGPTASGKTSFACKLAHALDTEIISGDSRQVYRNMDIGTGKDLSDYMVAEKQIPYHLIDIHDAGYKYNIYQYQHDFHTAYISIKANNKLPILCGGSGLYIESVLRGYNLINVPENKELRHQLQGFSLQQLTVLLSQYKNLHNSTDVDTTQRTIRAIEIEEYKKQHKTDSNEYPPINTLVLGVDVDRELRRSRISNRLKSRLDEGLIDEVQTLLDKGISADDLIYYGLEYKYVTQYLLRELSYNDMFTQLEIAIHQFAKRQMTWFRGMEKRGTHIQWINGTMPDDEKVALVESFL